MSRLQRWRMALSRRRALLSRGQALYCGHTLYFPLRSHVVERLFADGVYEPEVVEALLRLTRPGTAYFDVGANIGLLSLPVLARAPGVTVVSVEAGPETLPYLKRTHEAAALPNWKLVEAAAGDREGEVEFWTGGGAAGAFDGLKDTGRGGGKRPVRIPMLTLDRVWRDAGRPPVSVIKLDVEGAETLVLKGAAELIGRTRPALVMEWNAINLAAYGVAAESLFDLCEGGDYVAYAFPTLVPVDHEAILRLAMAKTDTFLLLPRTGDRPSRPRARS